MQTYKSFPVTGVTKRHDKVPNLDDLSLIYPLKQDLRKWWEKRENKEGEQSSPSLFSVHLCELRTSY